MPRRHLPVCAQLHETIFSLLHLVNEFGLTVPVLSLGVSSRGAGLNALVPRVSLCATLRTRTSPGSCW